MKKSLIIMICFTLPYIVDAQLTSLQWQDDLQFLKRTIHQKYPNLFYNVTPAQWDDSLNALYARVPELESYEIQASIGKLMTMFRIGHTQAGYLFSNARFDHQANTHNQTADSNPFPFVPMEFYQFSDGLYIKSADKKYEHLVGARILRIGDFPTIEALEKIRPYVNFENEQGFIANSVFYLRFPKLVYVAGISGQKHSLKLTYEKSSKINEVDIPVDANAILNFRTTGIEAIPNWVNANENSTNPAPLWLQESTKYRNIVYLKETRTVYIRHSVNLNDRDETINTFFTKAYDFIEKNDVEKLVLDLRTNGGGNNQLNKPIVTGIIRLKKINQKGKFFCILGRRTFSAAQNLVNELENYTEVLFVGEPTSENVNFYGDTKTETLPHSKIQVFCSWLWWQNKNPTDYRKATSPQLAVDMSFSDYANNIDPVLDMILKYRSDSLLAETIKELVLSQKHDDALRFATNYKNNPLHKYDLGRIESELNTLGYALLNDQKLAEAKYVFEINTKLFPTSGNVFDSYAELCLKMNLKEEAKKYYLLALQAEPGYANADAAKEIIKQLK